MADIVELLRESGTYEWDVVIMQEAADEIERLREALQKIAKHDLQAIAICALSPNEKVGK